MNPRPYTLEREASHQPGLCAYRIVTPAGPTGWRDGDDEYRSRIERQVDALNDAYEMGFAHGQRNERQSDRRKIGANHGI